MSGYEVWVLVDEDGKPVIDYNGNLEKVSSVEFASQLVEDLSLSNSSGEKWCRSKRFILSELKSMDWY